MMAEEKTKDTAKDIEKKDEEKEIFTKEEVENIRDDLCEEIRKRDNLIDELEKKNEILLRTAIKKAGDRIEEEEIKEKLEKKKRKKNHDKGLGA